MSDTLIGSIYGGAVVLVGAFLTWLATRGKTQADATAARAQLAEQGRQADISLIIKTLQGQVEDLQETTRDQAQELRAARQETRECLADRDQMRGELRRVRDRLAMLEKPGGADG
jgi:chromosome segregation ATPase